MQEFNKTLPDFEFQGTLLEKGRKEGAQQKAIEAAVNLLKMKLGTVEQIEKAQGLPRNYWNIFDCTSFSDKINQIIKVWHNSAFCK